MTTTERSFTVKGETFSSKYSDIEVAEKLANVKGNFARDLRAGFLRYRRFSPRQRGWAHKLVHDHEARQNQPKLVINGYQTIHQHLKNCWESRQNGGAGLLNPMVYLQVGDDTVVLKYSTRGKNQGKVSVAESHRFGEGRFFGWIDANGDYEVRGNKNDTVIAILDRVAVNPATVISEIGKESGLCCYCRAGLTQVQSKIAGCGKRCSSNYRVWYPNAAETREYLASHPEVLVGSTDANRWS